MATANPEPDLRLLHCPRCEYDLASNPRRGACPECGLKYDESTYSLNGALTTSGESLALLISWITVILLSATLSSWTLTLILVAVMALHLGGKFLLDGVRERKRLVLCELGISIAPPGREPDYLRWHLFEAARFELLAQGWHAGTDTIPEHALPRWRLTLVNAYKPTISTYLHRRGTDAPVFAESMVFTFHAPHHVVEALQRRIDRFIESATRHFRALRLKVMHAEPPDPEVLLHLSECPRCRSPLSRTDARSRCPECALACDASMFPLNGRLIQPRPSAAMFCLFPGFLAVVFGISGNLPLFQILSALSLVGGGLLLVLRFISPRTPSCRIVVTRQGLQIWEQGDLPRFIDWAHLPEFHRVQIEFDRWRLAFWDHPKTSVKYSPFFFTWLTSPSGWPVVDIVLAGDEYAGAMIGEEIQRRRGEPRLEHGIEVAGLKLEST